jgi:hypothetical protein
MTTNLTTHSALFNTLLVYCPINKFKKMKRFADTETGTSFTLTRETVRDALTAFALLTAVSMIEGLLFIEVICGTSHTRALSTRNAVIEAEKSIGKGGKGRIFLVADCRLFAQGAEGLSIENKVFRTLLILILDLFNSTTSQTPGAYPAAARTDRPL